MQVLVTGANGFVGKRLCQVLAAGGAHVYGVVRSAEKANELPAGVTPVVIHSLFDLSELDSLRLQPDGVVHLAARVHQMNDTAADPLAEFRKTNCHATEHLARWAAERGVSRFLFLSSIKVNGEGQGYPATAEAYRDSDLPDPQDPYGVSKWEAEQRLAAISAESSLSTVILRPTLVYGPEVRANFLRLLRLVASGVPIPLGGISNARSLIYLDNLADAIATCLLHEKAAGKTYLVSDGEDLSTPQLIGQLAKAMGRPDRQFRVPPSWLATFGRLTGKSDAVQRLLGNLQVDSSRIQRELDWTPPYCVQAGLQATVDWYLESRTSEARAA